MSNNVPGPFRPPSTGSGSAASASTSTATGTKKRSAHMAGLGGSEEKAALTDASGAYCPPAFGDFGLYMSQKRHKLYAQDELDRPPTGTGGTQHPQIFAGMSIHINGYVQEVTQQELKDMILLHGGRYDHYLSKSGTTHIVASNLTEAKKVEFRRFKVASPRWVLDSVAQGKLLPWHQYSVLASGGATLFDLGARPVTPGTASESRAPFSADAAATAAAPEQPQPTRDNASSSPKRDVANRSLLNAATDPDSFLTSFYQNSRLSHLSRWKAELQALTRPFQEFRALNPRPAAPHRVIFHVDMDSFFASVTLRDRPDLRLLPIAVSHSAVARDDSTSDIASCNYIARSFGLHNGMFVARAKQLCPALVLVPYAFEKYKETTEQVYTVLMDVADNLQAVSCDEAFVDVSSRISVPATPEKILQVAHEIRARIEQATGGCTASVGAAESMLLARLATRKAKPNGALWWTRQDYLRARAQIPIGDMPGVGRKMGKRLKEMGIETCLDVVEKVGKEKLMRELGSKVGQSLFDACEGVDSRTFGHRARQTVSAEVNYGIRFKSVKEAHAFLTKLSHEISQRLVQIGAQTSHITLKLMIRSTHAPVETHKFLGHGICDSHSRSVTLQSPTDSPQLIAQNAIALLDVMAFPPADLRGIGISCARLTGGQAEELQVGKRRRDGADLRKMFVRVAETAIKVRDRGQEADLGSTEDEGEDEDPTRASFDPGSCSASASYSVGGVDWAVFNDLPPNIQSEIRLQWKGGEQERGLQRKVESVPTTLWKGKAKANGKARVDASAHDRAEQVAELTDEQVEKALLQDVDASVLTALPPDIRAELLAAKRCDLEAEAAARLVALQLTPSTAVSMPTAPITLDSDSDSDSDIHRQLISNSKNAKINNVLTPPTASSSTTSTSPPSLLGRSDLRSIRSLLRDWITHTAHHSAETDVDTDAEFVARYAEALVEDGWMDWAKMVVQWLKFLVDGKVIARKGTEMAGEDVAHVVKELVLRVEERVREKVREMTQGGELDLDDW